MGEDQTSVGRQPRTCPWIN